MLIINALPLGLYVVEYTKVDELNLGGYLTREVLEGAKLPKGLVEAYCVSNTTGA